MAAFYPRMQKTAERLLNKFGMEFKLKRDGKRWVDDQTGQEHYEPEKLLSSIGVRTQYKPHEIDGSLIRSTDIKIVFSPNVEIKIGDKVFIDGIWLRVQAPNPIKPADIVICYQSQLRA